MGPAVMGPALMGPALEEQVVALDALLSDPRVWRGQPMALPTPAQPTGHAALDAVLPWGGWPEAALTEVLLPADGIGELRLLLPTLARLTRAGQDIAIVAPPYLPYPAGWQQAGVDFAHMHLIDANARDALWASEQCLRAGCLAAVLCWPQHADDRALRRLQVAADTGQVMGFAFRDTRAARNPSPAVLRIAIEPIHGEPAESQERSPGCARNPGHLQHTIPGCCATRATDAPVSAGAQVPRVVTQLRVLKCRGGLAPTRPIPFSIHAPAAA